MVDALTLAALTGVALTEGIKFLYNQADAILKRRAERRAAGREGMAEGSEQPVPVETPPVVAGRLKPVTIDSAAADELAEEIKALRRRLEDVAQGYETPRDGDPALLAAASALRDAIEAVIGQRITFTGEDRPATGSSVATGRITAKEIRGRATAVDIGTASGHVIGEVAADVIDKDADVTAVRIRRLGD